MDVDLYDCPCDDQRSVVPDPDDFECHLEDLNDYEIALGSFLVVGVAIAFLPQWYKIAARRSHSGLAYWTLVLGTINQWTTTANATILNYPRFYSCQSQGFTGCAPSLLGYMQVLFNAVFYSPIYMFYLWFFDFDFPQTTEKDFKIAKRCFMSVYAFLFFVFTIGGILMGTYGPCSGEAEGYAYSLGIIGTIANVFQLTPQIYETYRLKMCGSVSLLSLVFTAPGALLFFFFQAFISKESWTTWLGFLTSGVLQVILFSMSVYYTIQRKEKLFPTFSRWTSDESDPLLSKVDDPKPSIQSEY